MLVGLSEEQCSLLFFHSFLSLYPWLEAAENVLVPNSWHQRFTLLLVTTGLLLTFTPDLLFGLCRTVSSIRAKTQLCDDISFHRAAQKRFQQYN